MFTLEDFENESVFYQLNRPQLIARLLAACDIIQRRTAEADRWRDEMLLASKRAPWPADVPEGVPADAVLDVWPGDVA